MNKLKNRIADLIIESYGGEVHVNNICCLIGNDVIKINVEVASDGSIEKQFRPKSGTSVKLRLTYISKVIHDAIDPETEFNNEYPGFFDTVLTRQNGDVNWRGGNPFWVIEDENEVENIAQSMMTVISTCEIIKEVTQAEIESRIYSYVDSCHDLAHEEEAEPPLFPIPGSRPKPDFRKHPLLSVNQLMKLVSWSMNFDFTNHPEFTGMQNSMQGYAAIWASILMNDGRKGIAKQVLDYIKDANEFPLLKRLR